MCGIVRLIICAAGLVMALATGTPQAIAAQQQLPNYQCDDTVGSNVTPNCNPDSQPQSLYVGVSPLKQSQPQGQWQAVRLDPGSTSAPIDLNNFQTCNACYNLTNSGGNSIFVPINSCTEWTAFYNATQTGALKSIVVPQSCARIEIPTLPPDGDPNSPTYCGSPVLTQGAPELPYAPTGTYIPTTQKPYDQLPAETAQYSCTCTNGAPNWTETVSQLFQAGNPTWAPSGDPSYSGNTCATNLCPPPHIGSCEWGRSCPAAQPPGDCLDGATPSGWVCLGCDGPGADDIHYTCTLGAQKQTCHRIISTYCLPENC